MSEPTVPAQWADGVHALFRAYRVDVVSFVPDGGQKRLIELCLSDPEMRAVTLTTEEEGVVLDNERYGETGQQCTHTAMGVDLAAVTHGCGFPHTRTVRQAAELAALRADIHTLDGLLFAVVKVSPEELPRVLPPRDGPYLTQRLREALLGAEKALEA